MVDVFTSFPQPMSVKMIKHYLQLLLSGKCNDKLYSIIYFDIVIFEQAITTLYE